MKVTDREKAFLALKVEEIKEAFPEIGEWSLLSTGDTEDFFEQVEVGYLMLNANIYLTSTIVGKQREFRISIETTGFAFEVGQHKEAGEQ